MAAKDVPAQFEKLIPKALKSSAGHLEIIKFIKERIADQGALLECLRRFAASFAPVRKDLAEGPRRVGLAIYYTLLSHAIKLAGPMNELADFVLYIDALAIQSLTGNPPRLKFDLPKTTTAPQFELYKTLWLEVPEEGNEGRGGLRGRAMKARTALRDARTLTSVLSDAYQKQRDRKPTRNELFDYDPAPRTARKDFDRAVLACQTAYGQLDIRNKSSISLEARLTQLDRAFAALRKLLLDAGADPMAFFQMWRWAREPVWERSDENRAGKKISSVGAPSGSPHYEVYLEACYCALFLARSKWSMLRVQKSKELPAADRDLLIGPLAARDRANFEKRLVLGLMTPSEDRVDFDTLTRVRRRMQGVARDQGLDYLDEFETVDLMKKLIRVRKNQPELIENKVIRAASNYPALKDTFKIDQTVLDSFTIVWAEGTGASETVVVEFHKFSLQLFRLPANRLEDLVQNALWRKMQELGAQVEAFMLAYLEILGYAADVATAGMAGGGLRRFAVAYLKDKAREKGTDFVLNELGVDNPYARMLAHTTAGAVRVPKGKVRPADAPDAPSPRGTARDPGAITDAERGLAPKPDAPTVGATTGRTAQAPTPTPAPTADVRTPPMKAVDPPDAPKGAKAAKPKANGEVVDIGARRQEAIEQRNARLAEQQRQQQEAQYRKLADDQERALEEAHRRFAERHRLAQQQAARQAVTGTERGGDVVDLSARREQMLRTERENAAQVAELRGNQTKVATAGGGSFTTMGPGVRPGGRAAAATVGHSDPAPGGGGRRPGRGDSVPASGGGPSARRPAGAKPGKRPVKVVPLLRINIHNTRDGFNRELKAFLRANENHPLKAIYDRKNDRLHPSTDKGMDEFYWYQHPEAVQAGHSTSHHAAEYEKIVIMTAFDNQMLKSTIEGKGARASIRGGFDVAIIDDLPIKLTSAQHLVAFGKLDPKALERAIIVNVDDL